KTRSSFGCKAIEISPISSRNSVPLSASSSRPIFLLTAPVKAPFSLPNNSLSSNPRRNRRAVQFDETIAGAQAQPVDRPRHQFLSCSRFAQQQHGGIADRHFPHILHDGFQGLALPDDVPEPQFRIDFLLQIKLFFRKLFLGLA